MKLSKLFHWLYASVMMLPLVVVPIFAIYSHRHQINDYTVVSSNYELVDVDFNQYIFNGKPNNVNYWSSVDGTLSFDDGLLTSTGGEPDITYFINALDGYHLTSGTYKFVFDLYVSSYNTGDQIDFYLYNGDFSNEYLITSIEPSSNGRYYVDYTLSSDLDFDDDYYFQFYTGSFSSFSLCNFQAFNLTQMFGGTIPSWFVFTDYFNNQYYDYTLSSSFVISRAYNVTYDDTDIGSQFIYDMYNCVDKYFNYDKVVNFGALYGWLNTTFFSGLAPLGFFIFWHLLEYWLLTSLLWLLFDVLIYVPMLVHRWLDKASLS